VKPLRNLKPVLVMKFGGAALATPERVRLVARRIASAGLTHSVVAVVSAMGDETDRLAALVAKFTGVLEQAEADVVLAAGEQISAGLVALAVNELGLPARSFLGYQIRLATDGLAGDAKIVSVGTQALSTALAAGIVPVIAGFQGVDREGRIVTLGRGGSDTTAVAIAGALDAEFCELYKDVDGIFTADPKRDEGAVRLASLSYAQMEKISEREPQILHLKAVRLARALNVRLHVRSIFHFAQGTLVLPAFETTQFEIEEEIYA
jgi:aspartate kinase